MFRRAVTLALFLAPHPSLLTPVRADWPQFRGPTGQGVAEGSNPPTEWGPDKNVAWKVAVPGKGWSSPVVAGGRVFLTTAVPRGDGPKPDQSLRTLALDAKSGKPLWDVEVFQQDGKTAPPIHAKNSHASPTPFVDGDAVYVHFGHQGTACLATSDGAVRWAVPGPKYNPVHGNGGSPVVVGDKLIVAYDGYEAGAKPFARGAGAFRKVVARDKATGKPAWEFDRPQPAKNPFSFGTALPVALGGTTAVVVPGSDVVNALDPVTGKELWAVNYSGYSVVPRPVAGHGMVFLSTGFDTPVLLAIRPEQTGDRWSAKVVWKTNKDMPADASPLLAGDELYTVSDNGVATCLDAETGKVRWRERVGGAYTAAPLLAGGHVYLQDEAGGGRVLKAGKEYELVATNKLPGRTLASYAVDGDALLIRTEAELYRIERP